MRAKNNISKVITVIVFVILPFSLNLQAAQLNVPSQYSTIQAGINAADTGDTVIVAIGRYYENINFNGKAITVKSTNPDDAHIVEGTIIDANGAGSVVTFANGEDQNSILQGFTITGGTGTKTSSANTNGGGIYCYQSTPIISKNIIIGNIAPNDGGGIWVREASPTISENKFSGNSASRGGGIYGYGGVMIIKNNTFEKNSASTCGGVFARCESKVISNLFYNNTSTFAEGGGISFRGANNSTFYGNTLFGNLSMQGGANLDVQFNDSIVIANNIIVDGLNRPGVYFYQNTNITFKYNRGL